MKKYYKWKCCILRMASVIITAGFIFAQSGYVSADEVNTYERQLLDMMYGQYEYEGTIYVVDSIYISTAYNYFKSDGVDLTAEQYQAALEQLQGNIANGIETGYLIPYEQPEPETEETQFTTENNQKSESGQTDVPTVEETTQPETVEHSGEENVSTSLQETSMNENTIHTEEPTPSAEVVKLEDIAGWIEQQAETEKQDLLSAALLDIKPPTAWMTGILLAVGILLGISAIAAQRCRLLNHHTREERKHAEE